MSVLLLVACSDDPTAPGAGGGGTAWDEVTVSLDQIHVIQDCDGGSTGEFSYQFYVTEFIDGVEGTTHLSTAYSSASANNFTAWDPGSSATFQLERRPGVSFRVRCSMREFDTNLDFQEGRFYTHAGDTESWAPDMEYTLYDASQRIGVVTMESNVRSDCRVTMTYSVTLTQQ